MNRLSIEKTMRDDPCTEAREAENQAQERANATRLRDFSATHYDWMDHHSTFQTSEW
jgi:hypothetical protein